MQDLLILVLLRTKNTPAFRTEHHNHEKTSDALKILLISQRNRRLANLRICVIIRRMPFPSISLTQVNTPIPGLYLHPQFHPDLIFSLVIPCPKRGMITIMTDIGKPLSRKTRMKCPKNDESFGSVLSTISGRAFRNSLISFARSKLILPNNRSSIRRQE